MYLNFTYIFNKPFTDETQMPEKNHIPVLLEETLALIEPERGGSFLDCTFGGGGHSRAILERASKNSFLTAIDRDPDAVSRAESLSRDFKNSFKFHSINFSRLDELSEAPFDGILMDLGVSSFQLDDASRGFSFREDAPADMRMDTRCGVSAAEFLETSSRESLVEAIRDFGEEPHWRRVTDAIIAARGTGTLSSTATLAGLVERATRWRAGAKKIHPATKTFQGIRLAVNDELGELKRALPKAFAALKPNGILAVISFHSLEDRIVKRFFKEICGLPVDRHDNRCQDERERFAELLTNKAIRPSMEEVARNPRSRSSRLRAIRKI